MPHARRWPLLATATSIAGAAAALGDGIVALVAAVAVALAALAAVAMARRSRGDSRIALDVARVHTYTVELGRDGVVRTRRESHGLEHVLGGPLPAGAVPEAVWESCVDEADLPAYREHRSALRAGS